MKLYLGAGKDRKEGFIHADIYPFEGIDDVFDATEAWPYKDNTFTLVYSQDWLEHIDPTKKVFVINEMWRVLVLGGRMEHYIPNAGSRNDFGSPSHLSHWNLQQFEHFDIDSYRYKLDSDYEGTKAKFKTVLAEKLNWQKEDGGINLAQSIHVIYEKVI